jgi:2Fe-2S ferredoxin
LYGFLPDAVAARTGEKMSQVTYVDWQEKRYVVDVENGVSLMQAALDNLVPGILADCGGACACATCHVYVDPEWMGPAGEPSAIEAELLDGLLEPRPTSRLACQVLMNDKLDGIVLHIPESQL